jgi:hypothetical protein
VRGLAVGLVVKPGAGVNISTLTVASDYTPKDVPGPLDVLFNIVPQNPFRALAAMGAGKTADGQNVIVPSNGTVLQVIFFAGLIGFAFVKLGERTATCAGSRRGQRDDDPGDPFRSGVHPARHVRPDRQPGRRLRFRETAAAGQFRHRPVRGLRIAHRGRLQRLLLAHGLNPLKFFRGAAPAMQVGSSPPELRRDAGSRCAA